MTYKANTCRHIKQTDTQTFYFIIAILEKAQRKTSIGDTAKRQACDTEAEDIPACNSELQFNLFLLNENVRLQRISTLNELSDYLVDAPVTGNDNIDKQNNIMQKLINVPLKDAVHYMQTGEYLRNLHEIDHLKDVQIDIDGKTYFAHRVVLCCHSDYFANLFVGENESQNIQTELKITGICADAFEALLEFCYTGEISVYPDIAANILVAADFFKVRGLKGKFDEIAQKLPLDKCLKMLIKSKEHTSGKLYMIVFNRVISEFMAASMLEPFFDMDVDLFCRMIQSGTYYPSIIA